MTDQRGKAGELGETIALIGALEDTIAAAEDALGLSRSDAADPMKRRLQCIGVQQEVINEVMNVLALLDLALRDQRRLPTQSIAGALARVREALSRPS
jgi:hypothetical protein